NKLLEKKDRLKSKYVEVISHDIKASLSTIQSCLKVVLNGLTGSISFKSKEMVGRAEHRSRTLLYYVKGLWNLSQMRTTEKITKEKIPIFSAVESVIKQLRASFETKGLKLKINNSAGNPDVYGNDFLIKELIFNLLQNALKYTLKGGKVTIKIDGTAPSGYISISMMDTGIGIPKESISRIFEDFYRAKNAREIEKDGTGLGLAISKRIIDMHKWKIGFISEENKGSTFTVTIPKGE
ncbi:MAG: HAMP domain-containing histidine kinase, partial [Spirochaetes bacterium]|nr:HAMP domain-containing histidine kinase [Spirochaetota bacterium]